MDALAERKQLVERLRDDQRRCWQAGRPRKVEQYLVEYPTLATHEESLLDFIYSEVCLREECGETVEAAEYQQRFPHLATNLARLFEVHSLLEANVAEDHPLIVPVYDVGRHHDGRSYPVMELVEGQSLKDLLAGGALPSPVRAAELIATLAEVIDYAHRQGFVHRDLKPAKILVDSAGTPHVLDFGLAIHESCRRDRAGEMAGTVAYMAPKQVRRESHRLDGRADIWALGVMLYAMLTGRRPFDGIDLKDLCDEILHRQPKPPRQINDAIPQELERICLKCLRLDVSQRYLTARDLARDLRRWNRPRVRRPILAAVAIATVVLAATGIWFWITL